MAEFSAREDKRGEWISVRDGDLLISGHRAGRSENALTVYWRGRTDTDGLESFFSTSFRDLGSGSVSALVFTEVDRFRLDRLANREELKKKLPDKTRFMRLEFLQRGEGDDADEPTFIVWSRVGLNHIPNDRPAPDDIGVFLSASHMAVIKSELTEFVVKTHVHAPKADAVYNCVNDLAAYVGRFDRSAA
jgi:hypothetical protein